MYLYYFTQSLAEAALSVSIYSTSETSLAISWAVVEEVTATAFTIYCKTNNIDCFTECSTVSDIAGSEIMYTLTGLEEGTKYSITVTATLTGGGRTQQDTIIVTTMAAGESSPCPW